jgi:hypothetical protein
LGRATTARAPGRVQARNQVHHGGNGIWPPLQWRVSKEATAVMMDVAMAMATVTTAMVVTGGMTTHRGMTRGRLWVASTIARGRSTVRCLMLGRSLKKKR